MVTKVEAIDIVEVIYFAPVLPLTICICIKQGFSREAGWVLLTILSIIRVVGSSLGIAAANSPNDTGLSVGALILASIGSITLVSAFTGIVNRIENGSKQSPLSPRMRRTMQLSSIAAIVLASAGASNGLWILVKVAVILILVQFLVSSYILSCSARHLHAVQSNDRTLFYVTAAVVPFLLVRIVYSVLSGFGGPNSTTFNLASDTTTSTVVRALMATAMEIVIVTLLVGGGLSTPKLSHESKQEEEVSFFDPRGGRRSGHFRRIR